MQYFEMDCPCKGKNLDKLLQPSVLEILYRGPLHGFAVVTALGESAMCAGVLPDPTGVYRYLRKMEEGDLLQTFWEKEANGKRPIKMYEITPRGKACLMNWKIALSNYKHNIEKLLEEIEKTEKKETGCGARHAGRINEKGEGAYMEENRRETKIILLTGFLGSGKTTLLKRLLENCRKKIGVIVNEFGSVNIDVKLIETEGIAVAELLNGSVFCACIKDKFVDSLIEMSRRDLEYLFIEASGLADPSNMISILDGIRPYSENTYALAGEICVVDGQSFLDLADVLPALDRQIRHATAVLINKADLIDEERYRETYAYIREQNGQAKICKTVHCNIDVEEIMAGADLYMAESEETTNTYESRPTTVVLHGEECVAGDGLVQFLKELVPSTYRMKGFVHTDQGVLSVSAVGENIETETWGREEKTELVLISSVGIKIVSEVIRASKKYLSGKLYI
ncbi:MAG: hypothetical protein HFI88_08460 [Lachnospiraceae bacterium]|nr:hypothetical protein [Lachnospiraceae bacterium]